MPDILPEKKTTTTTATTTATTTTTATCIGTTTYTITAATTTATATSLWTPLLLRNLQHVWTYVHVKMNAKHVHNDNIVEHHRSTQRWSQNEWCMHGTIQIHALDDISSGPIGEIQSHLTETNITQVNE